MNKLSKLSTSERNRIEQCLALALNQNGDSDALAALKSARRMVSKHDMTLYDFYRLSVAVSEGTSDDDMSKLSVDLTRLSVVEQENGQLKRDLADAQGRIRRMEREHADMSTAMMPGVRDHTPVEGFYSYDAFYSALISHLGTPKRALSIFSEKTDIPAGRVQSWRRNNKVPEEAFKGIRSLDRNTPSFHQPLTGEHKRRIDRLSIEGKSDQAIADTMNLEFADRTFNVNMIKGAKTQIRSAFLADLKFDGKTRDEARLQFLQRYPNTRAVEKLLDKAFPAT